MVRSILYKWFSPWMCSPLSNLTFASTTGHYNNPGTPFLRRKRANNTHNTSFWLAFLTSVLNVGESSGMCLRSAQRHNYAALPCLLEIYQKPQKCRHLYTQNTRDGTIGVRIIEGSTAARTWVLESGYGDIFIETRLLKLVRCAILWHFASS